MNIQVVVFDIGGVLVDWNPRHLYRKILKNDSETIEYFLANICNFEWNDHMDAGRSFSEGVAMLKNKYPEYAELVEAYDKRWEEMLGDANWETVKILKQLKRNKMPVYALSNWSAEKFPIAQRRYDFFSLFDDMMVSGFVGVKKPNLEIFRLFLDTYNFEANNIVFIDDQIANIEAAKKMGMNTIHFLNAQQLGKSLHNLGVMTA